ncbi:serine dehydratase beta chain, partial [Kordiimonas sp.]|uniref:serine dehydratase beta chain n=1 Tax=Kordiimonas sp. TaxID=1970157 RepID=UPI003A95C61C
MSTSVLDLFNIGIGPSSSHTVGPMKAAREFVEKLDEDGLLDNTERLVTKLYGSLGATGRGHGSDGAVILGLLGECPREVDVENIPSIIKDARETKTVKLMGKKAVKFEEDTDLQLLPREQLPFHPNGMEFWAYGADGDELSRAIYYSIGGGFIVHEKEAKKDKFIEEKVKLPYPFKSGAELLEHCTKTGKPI